MKEEAAKQSNHKAEKRRLRKEAEEKAKQAKIQEELEFAQNELVKILHYVLVI